MCHVANLRVAPRCCVALQRSRTTAHSPSGSQQRPSHTPCPLVSQLSATATGVAAGAGASVTFGKVVLPNGVITSASDDNPTGSSLSMEIGEGGDFDLYNA